MVAKRKVSAALGSVSREIPISVEGMEEHSAAVVADGREGVVELPVLVAG